MISKEQRIKLEELIEAATTALCNSMRADFASEVKARAAFDYVRASDNLDSYLTSLTEAPTAADHGWIEWGGGVCPVGEGVSVDVKTRGKETWHNLEDATLLVWADRNLQSDIIAYRVVS